MSKNFDLANIRDLESALRELAKVGETVHYVHYPLSPKFEIAAHYCAHAGAPATSRSQDEGIFVYTGASVPVLMGLFGSRRRNNTLLMGKETIDKHMLAQQIAAPVPPQLVANPPSQQIVMEGGSLGSLPILHYTPRDGGRYITSGIVYAQSPSGKGCNVSIHRLCIIDDQHCTIWMVPGRHLETMYREAMALGQSLPISINIGGDPVVYLASAFSQPHTGLYANEMQIAGAIRQRPVEVARCVTSAAKCLAQAEIVLEAEMLPKMAPEGSTGFSMPEFLGYMGETKAQLPLVRVNAITTKQKPLYQTFLGPGREQSELLAIPQEISILSQLPSLPGLKVLDVHCPSYSGGLLAAVVKIAKTGREGDDSVPALGRRILETHKYVKNVFIADEDIDIYSPEDVFWAMTTRMQLDVDLHVTADLPGFPMDPSQTLAYRRERVNGDAPAAAITSKGVFDCTCPYKLTLLMQRAEFH